MKLNKNIANIVSSAVGLWAGISTGVVVKKATDSDGAAVAATIGSAIVTGSAARYLLTDLVEKEAANTTPEFEDFEDDGDPDVDCLEYTGDESNPAFQPVQRPTEWVFNSETLRDFCGSFYVLAPMGRFYGLLNVMPNAIWRYVEMRANEGATRDEKQATAHQMMEEVVRGWMDDQRTSETIKRWIGGAHNVEKITPLELVYLLDVGYIDCLPSEVEYIAADLIPTKDSGPDLSPEELAIYNQAEPGDPVLEPPSTIEEVTPVKAVNVEAPAPTPAPDPAPAPAAEEAPAVETPVAESSTEEIAAAPAEAPQQPGTPAEEVKA